MVSLPKMQKDHPKSGALKAPRTAAPIIRVAMGASTPRLVVIGSLNLDLVLGIAHLPVAGATETVQSYTQMPGGKGANQAVAAARLGSATSMVGMVGDDAAGSLLLRALHEAGVAIEGVARSSVPTGTAVVLLTPAGENSILVAPGANGLLNAAHLRSHADLLQEAGMLLMQLETPVAILEAALALAAEAGVPVMLDPAPAAALPAAVLGGLAWFTPNLSEALFYARFASSLSLNQLSSRNALLEEQQAGADTASPVAHEQTPDEELDRLLRLREAEASAALALPVAQALCRRIQALGPENILLKLGEAGAGALTGSGVWHFEPAPSVAVVDTTGAGDVLNAAFATALLAGAGIPGALSYAVAAASASVTRRGAMVSSPTQAEMAALLGFSPNERTR